MRIWLVVLAFTVAFYLAVPRRLYRRRERNSSAPFDSIIARLAFAAIWGALLAVGVAPVGHGGVLPVPALLVINGGDPYINKVTHVTLPVTVGLLFIVELAASSFSRLKHSSFWTRSLVRQLSYALIVLLS